MGTMKAVVQDRYGAPGEVLQVREVERPPPKAGEVLVRVQAASVHADVWHVVTGVPKVLRLMGAGVRRPVPAIPGTDLAGVVEAVGPDVSQFRPGDEVYGEVVEGFQWKHGATYAELATAPAKEVALKPKGLSFEQAAALPTAGLVALRNLLLGGEVRPGCHILINGAGGAVGTLALQFAKAFGARVTTIDHGGKLDLLRSLGADDVIDYTVEDFTRRDERYDMIYDVASTLKLSECKRVLTPTGFYVLIGHDHYGEVGRRWLGSIPRAFGLMGRSLFSKHLPKPDFETGNEKLLPTLVELAEAGKLTPVVDKTYPLGEVPEALQCLVEGRANGRIVIVP